MDNFDLKKFLVENKLTNQTRKLNEGKIEIDNFKDGLEVFFRFDNDTYESSRDLITLDNVKAEVSKWMDQEFEPGYDKDTVIKGFGGLVPAGEVQNFKKDLYLIATQMAVRGNRVTLQPDKQLRDGTVDINITFSPPLDIEEFLSGKIKKPKVTSDKHIPGTIMSKLTPAK
jgi:hypothetical protein